MCFTWHGALRAEQVVNLGPLALLDPLLQRMQVADIIDRHLPPDPQLEFSHGQVLSLLLAARLSSPSTRARKTAAGASRRNHFRPRKRPTWARCRGSERTAPAARTAPIRPRCMMKATTQLTTRDSARCFSPSGRKKDWSWGRAARMMTIGGSYRTGRDGDVASPRYPYPAPQLAGSLLPNPHAPTL